MGIMKGRFYRCDVEHHAQIGNTYTQNIRLLHSCDDESTYSMIYMLHIAQVNDKTASIPDTARVHSDGCAGTALTLIVPRRVIASPTLMACLDMRRCKEQERQHRAGQEDHRNAVLAAGSLTATHHIQRLPRPLV